MDCVLIRELGGRGEALGAVQGEAGTKLLKRN